MNLSLPPRNPSELLTSSYPLSEPVSVAKEWDDLLVEVKSLPSRVIAGCL